MESSTVLAFRIFVMLSCLIIVPLAAIFGSAFPNVVKSVLIDRIVAFSTGKPAATPPAAGGYQESPAANRAAPRANVPPGWEAPRWSAAGNTTAGGWQAPDGRPAGGVVPAGAAGGTAWQDAPLANLAVAAEPRVPNSHLQERGQVDPTRASVYERSPASRDSIGHAPTSVYESPASPGGLNFASPADQPDRFTSMERKLREYGATYYLLETQGQQGELYRFHCKMAVGGNANFTQPFEASDRDPLKAMSKVVEQVESWRFGRPQ